MDAVLEFVAHLDWFERVDALIRALCGQRSYRIRVVRACGVSGRQMEQLLKAKGIPVWDRNFNREYLSFRVPVQQARWAVYLLTQAGVPVVGKSR